MTASTVPDRRAECTRFGCASTRSPTAASISPALRRVPIREKDPRWNIGGLPKPIGGRDAPRQGLPKAVVGGRNEPVVGDFIACGDRITHHDRRHRTGSGRMGDHSLVSKSERRVTPIRVTPPHPRLAMITWARGRPGRRLRRWLWEEQYATYLGHCGLRARTRSRRSRRAAGNAEAPSHPKEVAS